MIARRGKLKAVSRAFVRETDGEQDEPPRPRPQLPPGLKNHITPAGAKRFQTELDQLLERRGQFLRAEGAVPAERAEEKREVEMRIRVLQQILDSVVVTAPPTMGRDRVCFGAALVVHNARGEKEKYKIVGLDEAEPERGHISWRSPLARALLSHRAGDTISFQTPSGPEDLQILDVSYDD